MGGTPSSASIIKDVDRALEALEIVFRAYDDAVEGVSYRNGHILKEVGEGNSVSWGGARTKGEGHECKISKNMFFHSDLLKLYLKKKRKITEFLPDAFFLIKNLCCKLMR